MGKCFVVKYRYQKTYLEQPYFTLVKKKSVSMCIAEKMPLAAVKISFTVWNMISAL